MFKEGNLRKVMIKFSMYCEPRKCLCSYGTEDGEYLCYYVDHRVMPGNNCFFGLDLNVLSRAKTIPRELFEQARKAMLMAEKQGQYLEIASLADHLFPNPPRDIV